MILAPQGPAGQAAEVQVSPGEGQEMEALWYSERVLASSWLEVFHRGAVSETFGKEEREKQSSHGKGRRKVL